MNESILSGLSSTELVQLIEKQDKTINLLERVLHEHQKRIEALELKVQSMRKNGNY